jgi:hypothetical protein
MEKEFGRIKKNSTTDIVIRISEYKGSTGLDIREYVESDRYTGWSKSGVRIPEDQICQLGKLIAEACKEVKS